jgi:acetyltransferase-like isoleucine patch superfamily enzyme
MGENIFNDDFKHGKNFSAGKFCIIKEDVIVGDNITIGDYVKIMPGTRIGNNTIIMDYVKLMPGTIVGNNCKLDDYVNTSGYVDIGNNIRIKRCSMIGQAVKIEDGVWIGSGVTTTRLKNPIDKNCKEEWIFIKKGAMIGSKSLLLAGVTIGEGSVIAAGAVVSKDCVPHGVYVGCPAKLTRVLNV